MNGKNVPVITFLGYRVTDILYRCDPTFESINDKVSYKFNFNKTNILVSDKEIQENVRVNVFYGTDENFETSKFQLSIEIAGRFECTDNW